MNAHYPNALVHIICYIA